MIIRFSADDTSTELAVGDGIIRMSWMEPVPLAEHILSDPRFSGEMTRLLAARIQQIKLRQEPLEHEHQA